MKKSINEQRPKAFIGAAISVGTQLIGGIIGGAKKRRAERRERLRQERLQNFQNNQAIASAQNEAITTQEDKEAMLDEFYRAGGKTSKSSELSPRKGVAPNIAEGGTAIPIKKNTYLLKGRKHETGGIVIGRGKKSIEAEGNEVVQITPKNLKVFSAQPIINGNSPAELVQRGAEPDKVFNAQERFKDINGLNDDGTRKKKAMGGKDKVKQDNTSIARPAIIEPIERKISPVDRVNVPVGTKYSDLSPADKIRLKISDNVGKDYKGLEIVSPEFDLITAGQTGLLKAASKAGTEAGSSIAKSFAKETSKELVSNAVSTVASEINPLLGLLPVSPSSKSSTKATRALPVPTKTIESKKIAGLLESPEKMTRDQLKKINAVGKRFGYKPIPLEYAKDRAKAEEAVKDLVNQHNTFLRGVRPLNKKQYDSVARELSKKGIEVNEDNVYKYVSTHLAPETGAGRADVGGTSKGVLYTSNSGNQAAGYAGNDKFDFPGVKKGKVAKVRRPVNFDSPRMTDWWVNNDFNFADEMSYYRRKLLDENIAKYGKLPDNIRNEIKSAEDITFNTLLKDFESSPSNNHYGRIISNRIKHIDEKNAANPSRAVKYERYNMDKASAVEQIAYSEYLRNIINNGSKKSYSEFLKEKRASLTKEFRKKAHDKAIKDVAEKQGHKFDPNKANIYYTRSYGLHGSTRNTGNPRQHFIFTGNPGNKELDFVDYYEPTKEEILTGSREHNRAVYTEGFSRRSRKLGGTINKNNTIMRIGGNRKRFPVLTGEYHGANEGRAIRSLREARGDSRYQYAGSTNNTPNTSTASMYEKLPLAATSRTAIQQTNKKYNTSSPTGGAVKNQSFNSAFAAARKSGAKTFEYNGRTYSTQLATTKKSNVLPEVVVTASRPKSKSNVLPEVTVATSRIPKMIKDNAYVPGQYPDTRSPKSNTTSRQSTAKSIYKGLKSALGVPERRKRLGGLSRKEDYGSSKKPYPNVNSKDFAVGNRSYPIPTKADARDALRLAGLHGRSDVRSRVYKKYPELRKKAAYGASYTIPETTVTGRRLKNMSPIKPSFNIGNPSVDSLPVKATIDRSVMNPAGITSGAKITNPSAGKITPISSTGTAGNSGGGNGGFFSKIGNAFKGNTGELISAGIGAVGSIISGAMNKSSIDNIQAPQVPTPRAVRPARMKTSYNIAPQLSEIRESEKNLRRVIASNTSSSAASISRQQRVANDAVMQRNKLRGTKENIETQLYNQDALNRQEVESRNTAAVNEANRYNAISAAQTANEKIQAKANNRTQMIEGLTSAVRDYQLGVDSKRRDDLTFAAEAAKNPEQLDLFMNLMKKNKGRINELGFRLGGRNKLLCGGRKKVS